MASFRLNVFILTQRILSKKSIVFENQVQIPKMRRILCKRIIYLLLVCLIMSTLEAAMNSSASSSTTTKTTQTKTPTTTTTSPKSSKKCLKMLNIISQYVVQKPFRVALHIELWNTTAPLVTLRATHGSFPLTLYGKIVPSS